MLKEFQTLSLSLSKEKYPSGIKKYLLAQIAQFHLTTTTVLQKANLSAPHAGKTQCVKATIAHDTTSCDVVRKLL